MISLHADADKLTGAESLKTEEQIIILIFKFFSTQFCEQFVECNQSE